MGINITASHNPFFYNGVKIRMGYGGTPKDTIIKKIESYFGKKSRHVSNKGLIKKIDPFSSYCDAIRKLVDIKKFGKRRLNVLVDTMQGIIHKDGWLAAKSPSIHNQLLSCFSKE